MDRPPEDVEIDIDVEPARRPRDLALLLLAIGTGPPRARARDQQADLAGGDLLRRVLDRLAAIDPEPDAIEPTLAMIVSEFGEPTGPTRGVCSLLLQEWNQTQLSPNAWAWLLSEALQGDHHDDSPRQGKRRSRGAP